MSSHDLRRIYAHIPWYFFPQTKNGRGEMIREFRNVFLCLCLELLDGVKVSRPEIGERWR